GKSPVRPPTSSRNAAADVGGAGDPGITSDTDARHAARLLSPLHRAQPAEARQLIPPEARGSGTVPADRSQREPPWIVLAGRPDPAQRARAARFAGRVRELGPDAREERGERVAAVDADAQRSIGREQGSV